MRGPSIAPVPDIPSQFVVTVGRFRSNGSRGGDSSSSGKSKHSRTEDDDPSDQGGGREGEEGEPPAKRSQPSHPSAADAQRYRQQVAQHCVAGGNNDDKALFAALNALNSAFVGVDPNVGTFGSTELTVVDNLLARLFNASFDCSMIPAVLRTMSLLIQAGNEYYNIFLLLFPIYLIVFLSFRYQLGTPYHFGASE